MLEKIINSKSKTFFTFCFYFLAGIIIFSIFELHLKFVYLYLFLFISISQIIIFWKNKKVRFVFLCFSFFVFSVVRYQLAFPLSANDISHYYGEIMDLQAVVVDEPDIRQDKVNYVVKSIKYKAFVPSSGRGVESASNVNGRLYLQLPLYPRYNYGDELKLTCRVNQPEPTTDGFRYDMYLARFGIFALCTNPQVQRVGEGSSAHAQSKEGNFFYDKIFKLKNAVAQKVQTLWVEPQASFMAGLLYGYRGGLGDYNELFNRTGVSHIVAVSGYNISVIAVVLSTILIYLWVPRKKAFWLIVGGIILFVIFTGASASAVRAGVMGIVALLAKQLGRLSRLTNILVLAVVVMAVQNPLVLIWDAGFQLSFAAMCGLVFIAPLIEKPLKKLFHINDAHIPQFFLSINEALAVTLSAIIATLPLILYQFGRLSIVAPLVNLLILWIIPYIMLLGFVSVILAFVFQPLGQLLAYLGHFGLQYILIVVKWFGNLTFSAVEMKISWWVMVVMYGVMIYIIYKKTKPRTPITKLQ